MGESMRKQKMKKILYLLAAGVLLLMSMSGCGKEAETGKTQVAMIVKSTESAFFKSVFAGARAAATEYNLNVTFNGPESEEDYVTQNEMVRQAMEDGVDVIVFSAVDYNANAEIIGQAAQRGIKIVVIDSDVNSSMVSCRIGTNNLQAGVKAAEAALAVGEDELYIGIVNYDVNSANGQQRELGFRQTVEQDPRVKDITTINVLSTTEDARAGTKEMLLSDSRINVVVTFNEWTSLGVGWAIRDLDLETGRRWWRLTPMWSLWECWRPGGGCPDRAEPLCHGVSGSGDGSEPDQRTDRRPQRDRHSHHYCDQREHVRAGEPEDIVLF